MENERAKAGRDEMAEPVSRNCQARTGTGKKYPF